MLEPRGTDARGAADRAGGPGGDPAPLPRSHDWLAADRLRAGVRGRRLGAGPRAPGGPPTPRRAGTMLIFRQLREAELALGVGDEDEAAACLEIGRPTRSRVTAEPQWIGAVRRAAGRTAPPPARPRRRPSAAVAGRARPAGALHRRRDADRAASPPSGSRSRPTARSARAICGDRRRARATRWRAPGSTSSAWRPPPRRAGRSSGPGWRRGAAEMARARGRDARSEWAAGGPAHGRRSSARTRWRSPAGAGRVPGRRRRSGGARPRPPRRAGSRPRALGSRGWSARSRRWASGRGWT